MFIRVQQKDGQIAEIWLGDRYRNLMIWEGTADKVNELVIRNEADSTYEFGHPFDENGYLLPDKYKEYNDNYSNGSVENARIYIPPKFVKTETETFGVIRPSGMLMHPKQAEAYDLVTVSAFVDGINEDQKILSDNLPNPFEHDEESHQKHIEAIKECNAIMESYMPTDEQQETAFREIAEAHQVLTSNKEILNKRDRTFPVYMDKAVRIEFPQENISLDSKHEIEVSDGHHTMEELYEHRNLLFIALCRHLDSDDYFIYRWKVDEDWFLLTTTRPSISYRLPMKYWDLCDFAFTEQVEFDGHTSDDVLERLKGL